MGPGGARRDARLIPSWLTVMPWCRASSENAWSKAHQGHHQVKPAAERCTLVAQAAWTPDQEGIFSACSAEPMPSPCAKTNSSKSPRRRCSLHAAASCSVSRCPSIRSKNEVSISSQKQEKVCVCSRMSGAVKLCPVGWHDLTWPPGSSETTGGLGLLNRCNLTARVSWNGWSLSRSFIQPPFPFFSFLL